MHLKDGKCILLVLAECGEDYTQPLFHTQKTNLSIWTDRENASHAFRLGAYQPSECTGEHAYSVGGWGCDGLKSLFHAQSSDQYQSSINTIVHYTKRTVVLIKQEKKN